MWFLNVIPKSIQTMLLISVCCTVVAGAAYYKGFIKGVSKERIVWELREQEFIDSGIKDLNKKLEEALEFKKAGATIITSLEGDLNNAQDKAKNLQVKLDELLETPPTICDSIPVDEFRLYQELFNQAKPE